MTERSTKIRGRIPVECVENIMDMITPSKAAINSDCKLRPRQHW